MDVTSATAAAAQQSGAGQSSQASMVDYQSFLKLLVAQMKNQDPTSPMEATDYVAQLATFSQVEQSIQINTRLDSILQASALTQATAMIGREVSSPDGLIKGTVTEVRLYSDGAVATLDTGEKVVIEPGIIVK
jgi:flagellar basal-body rod modification protein FlgD